MKLAETFLWTLLVPASAVSFGCTSAVIQPQHGEELSLPESDVVLIGSLARPHGMTYVKVEGVSLVTGLDGNGGDPPPSTQRATLMAEMLRRDVSHPAKLLASPKTALVALRGFLRPGMQKGDRFDVEVQVPVHSNAQSLQGGWLLPSRLTELAVLDQQIRTGHYLATADGPVLVDSSVATKESEALLIRGQVLGGGVALKSRTVGLLIDSEYQSIGTSQQIGTSLNQRFHSYHHGTKQGVATPKTDQFIELIVHPRYRSNVSRFMRVVRSVAYRETPTQRQERLELLRHQLLDPLTAASAATRLEAIGRDAVDTLKLVLESDQKDPEVRFYAAETLAYLDQTIAAEALKIAALEEPPFRAHALAALSAMDDVAAYEALTSLLTSPSAETRYGAFRALRTMRPEDPLVHGEQLRGQFSYHLLDVDGPPMIHATRSFRPELVLFGNNQRFDLPMIVDAGKNIIVNGLTQKEVTVSRFALGEPDQQRVMSDGVDEVVRAIVDLGGTYSDVVQTLQMAKDSGALNSRLRFDALPGTMQIYERNNASSHPLKRVKMSSFQVIPNIFRHKPDRSKTKDDRKIAAKIPTSSDD